MEMMDRGCVSVCCLPKWLLLQCCVWHKGGCSSSVECKQWGAEISDAISCPIFHSPHSLGGDCLFSIPADDSKAQEMFCWRGLSVLNHFMVCFLPFSETWHRILSPPAPQPLPPPQRCCANLTNANFGTGCLTKIGPWCWLLSHPG